MFLGKESKKPYELIKDLSEEVCYVNKVFARNFEFDDE